MVLLRAILTGCFCSVFALAIDSALAMVSAYGVMVLAALSGFLGSLFAHFVLRNRQ